MFIHSSKINKDHFHLTSQFHHTVICIHILCRLLICAKFLKLHYGRIQDEHVLMIVFHWVTCRPVVFFYSSILHVILILNRIVLLVKLSCFSQFILVMILVAR